MAESSQIEILNRARGLADDLARASTPVKANTLRSILADFMSSPEPDAARLRRTLDLLGEGSGGHLARSGSFPDQAKAAIQVLVPYLDRTDLEPQQLKTLFGWTARLLLVRGEPKRSRTPRPPRRHGPPRRKPVVPEEPRKLRPKASKLGAFGGSSLADLAKMKEQLAKKEGDENGG